MILIEKNPSSVCNEAKVLFRIKKQKVISSWKVLRELSQRPGLVKKRLSDKKYDEEDENDISYEYMDPFSDRDSSSYENFNPQDLRQSLPKPELSEKRVCRFLILPILDLT